MIKKSLVKNKKVSLKKSTIKKSTVGGGLKLKKGEFIDPFLGVMRHKLTKDEFIDPFLGVISKNQIPLNNDDDDKYDDFQFGDDKYDDKYDDFQFGDDQYYKKKINNIKVNKKKIPNILVKLENENDNDMY